MKKMPMEYISLTDWYSLQTHREDGKCNVAPGQGHAGLAHLSEAGTCNRAGKLPVTPAGPAIHQSHLEAY